MDMCCRRHPCAVMIQPALNLRVGLFLDSKRTGLRGYPAAKRREVMRVGRRTSAKAPKKDPKPEKGTKS